MAADTWIHVAELVILGIIVPSLKKLIGTIVDLRGDVTLLRQSLSTHASAFAAHVREDHEHFQVLDQRVNSVDGNVREVMGLLRVERRSGMERRAT